MAKHIIDTTYIVQVSGNGTLALLIPREPHTITSNEKDHFIYRRWSRLYLSSLIVITLTYLIYLHVGTLPRYGSKTHNGIADTLIA